MLSLIAKIIGRRTVFVMHEHRGLSVAMARSTESGWEAKVYGHHILLNPDRTVTGGWFFTVWYPRTGWGYGHPALPHDAGNTEGRA